MYQAPLPAGDEDPVDQINASMPPGNGTEAAPHVFLSHAGEQKMSVVDVVRARLEDNHPQLGVFADEWSLQPGDRPMARMGAACWGAAVGVVLLSKEFVRKTQCMAELRILLRRSSAQEKEQHQQHQHQHQQQGREPGELAAKLQRVSHSQQAGSVPVMAAAGRHPSVPGSAPVADEAVVGISDPAAAPQPSDQQGSRQLPVQLLPVLFELTVEELKDMRALYDLEPWYVDQPKPPPAVLDAWAADLQQAAGFTLIHPDQWRGYSQLAEAIEARAVELLAAAGKLPPAAVPTMEVRSTVAPPEQVQLVGRQQELGDALRALKEGRYVELCGGPGEGKTLLAQQLMAVVSDEWRQLPVPEAGGKVAHALEVDLTLEGLTKLGLKDGTDLKNVLASQLLSQVQEPADKEQWQVLQGWLRRQAPAPVLIALENAEQCVAAPEDSTAASPIGMAFQEALDQLSRHGHVHLIVATRVRTPGISRALPAGSVVVLRQLKDAEGLQLLESWLDEGRLWGADGECLAAAKRLVQLVQCNPLALAVAVEMRRKGRTWEEVVLWAERDIAKVNGKSHCDPMGMEDYMAALRGWLEACLGGPERQLLASISLFPGSFTAPAAAAVSAATEHAGVGEILELLVDMSLLQRRVVSGVSRRQPELSVVRYSMHALVRCAVLDQCAKEQSSGLLARWMLVNSEGPGQALLRCDPSGVPPDTAMRLHQLCEELPNFAAAGAGLLAAAAAEDFALIDAALDVGRHLSECGHGFEAWQLQQCAVETAVTLLGPVHPDTLAAKVQVGVTLQRMGELSGARQLQAEALDC